MEKERSRALGAMEGAGVGEVSFVILFKDDQARAPILLLFKRLLLLRGALSNVPARTRSGSRHRTARPRSPTPPSSQRARLLPAFLPSQTPFKYRGLYACDPTGSLSRLIGPGPPCLEDGMVSAFFKYDTGAKTFRPIAGARGFAGSTAAVALKAGAKA